MNTPILHTRSPLPRVSFISQWVLTRLRLMNRLGRFPKFVIGFVVCGVLYAGQVNAAATLRAYYPLEDLSWTGAANEVQDFSGKNRHGQAIGSPLPVPDTTFPARPGNPGTCGYGVFPGPQNNGGALLLPVKAKKTPMGQKYTVSFWMFWDGTNNVMPIGWKRYDLWLVNGHFGFNTSNNDVYGISSAGLENRWVHVVAVFTNGNVTANELYIDGVAQSLTQRQGTPINTYAVASKNLQVSGWQNTNGYRFSGRIDEVRVYKGALTQAEVTALYNETHACPPPPPPAMLLAYYPLEDTAWTGANGEVKDVSGNNRDGQAFSGGGGFPVPETSNPARSGDPGTCGYAGLPPPNWNNGGFTLPVGANTAPGARTSVSFWMYWDGTNSVMPIGWGRYDLWLYNGYFGFNTSMSDIYGISSTGLANRWVHVVAVFTNGSVAANKLYIDGVLQNLSQQLSAPNPTLAFVTSNLQVSGWQHDQFNRFAGRIDEVKVYSGELTPAEVNALYNETHPCGGSVIPANFNCVAAGEDATNGRLFTQLVGTPFSFEVVALKNDGTQETQYAANGNKTVTVELVDGSGNTACASRTPLTPPVSQTLTFTAGDHGRKAINLTVNDAYKNLRCRVTDANQPPPVIGCSSDNFAVRPQQFSITANLGGPKLEAGLPFTLEADSGTLNYDGQPTLDIGLMQDHNGNGIGSLSGSFPQANNGKSTGSFAYHDVGTIQFLPDAVRDANYTTVDKPGDCLPNSTSNTLSNGGKYGCDIGSVPAGPFGRFYPHHFTYTATLTPACSGGFTYMDQPNLGIQLSLEARSVNETVTTRYTAGYSHLGTFEITGVNAGSPVNISSRLTPSLPGFVWSNGSYSVNSSYTFTRDSTPDGPYDDFALKATILSEPDGVAISGSNLSTTTQIRYGRLKLSNVYGSELLPLQVPITVQYFDGSNWLPNTLDSCTQLEAKNFSHVFGGNLTACVTAGTLTGSAPNFVLELTAPGAGNHGTDDITAELGNSASGITCTTQGGPGPAASAANLPWLQSPTNTNPTVRATFGVYKGNNTIIYQREVY